MALRDIATNLGDSIAGVDRQAAFQTGRLARAKYDDAALQPDLTRAQTDAALELAKQRRFEAERAEQEKLAIDRMQQMDPAALADPSQVPLGDLLAGRAGTDYSGAMLGRNRGQEFQLREEVAEPALGDAILEGERSAALEALAPGSAVASRRPTAGRGASSLVVAVDPDSGEAVYTTQADAVGRRPGARPAASRTGPGTGTANERNIDDLLARGIDEELAISLVYNRVRDPRQAYLDVFRDLRRNFTDDDAADIEARTVVERLYGPGALEAARDPIADAPDDVDTSGDTYEEGAIIRNPSTGERMTLRNNQWVPL